MATQILNDTIAQEDKNKLTTIMDEIDQSVKDLFDRFTDLFDESLWQGPKKESLLAYYVSSFFMDDMNMKALNAYVKETKDKYSAFFDLVIDETQTTDEETSADINNEMGE